MLLQSKFFIPPQKRQQLQRLSLLKQISYAIENKLTLVIAGAGYGKTNLLSQWSTSNNNEGGKTAWITLDFADNDPALFWRYIASALQQQSPAIGTEAIELLGRPLEQGLNSVIFSLLNDLAGLSSSALSQVDGALSTAEGSLSKAEGSTKPIYLVLDDLHKIDNEQIFAGLDYLLEYLPQSCRIIVSSRVQPALSLSRLRSDGELMVLRTEKVRFTLSEVQEFVHRKQGLELSAEALERLYRKTEGWPTGLQLASYSILEDEHHEHCLNDHIAAEFIGRNSYAADYLMEEVFDRQSPIIQAFLFAAATPSRFSAQLCSVILSTAEPTPVSSLAASDGSESIDTYLIVRRLEASNLFLTALDPEGIWYRLHDLFRESIRARFEMVHPDRVRPYQLLAARGFVELGLPENAIELLLEYGHWAKAADLIEFNGFDLLQRGQHVTVDKWLLGLPQNLIQQRLKLLIMQLRVWSLSKSLHLNPAEHYLRLAEDSCSYLREALAVDEAPLKVNQRGVISSSELMVLQAELTLLQSNWARMQGDVKRSLELSQAALNTSKEQALPLQSKSLLALGMGQYLRGDIKAGTASVAKALSTAKLEGDFETVESAAVRLAWVYQWQGQFKVAYQVYTDSRAFLDRHNKLSMSFICWQNLALAAMYREFNELAKARDCLDKVYSQLGSDPSFAITAPLNQCKLLESEGDFAGALVALEQAEVLYQPIAKSVQGFPSIAAMRGRIGILQNNPLAVESYVSRTGRPVQKNTGYRHEEERITLARAWLFLGKVDQELMSLIDDILAQAVKGNHISNIVVLRLLAAMAHYIKGDKRQSVEALQQALPMAASCGYVRSIIDERPVITEVLELALDHKVEPFFTQQCINLIQSERSNLDRNSPEGNARALIEPLSLREKDVLALLDKGLQNKQIAEQLCIGIGTVKTHMRNILGKLSVRNRTQAVSKAREFGLLG